MTISQLKEKTQHATTESALRDCERQMAAMAVLALEYQDVEFALRRMEEMARLTKVRQQVTRQSQAA